MPLPRSYSEWRTCIEVHCRIPLTVEFVDQRLRELDDGSLLSTEQLLRHYGQAHVEQLREWFRKARGDLHAQ